MKQLAISCAVVLYNMKIPKTIHYCWYGESAFQNIHIKCQESWKTHLPDFAVKKWDETNSPLDANLFVREAYRLKRWAFVADYVRIHALFHEGGVYLDTDMLVLKAFGSLLNYQAFAGFEDSQHVAFGIFGAISHHPFLQNCLTWYDTHHFNNDRPLLIPQVVSSILREQGMENNVRQTVSGVELFPCEYFYPWPFAERLDCPNYRDFIKPESYAVHLWNHSWKLPESLKTRLIRRLSPFISPSLKLMIKKVLFR